MPGCRWPGRGGPNFRTRSRSCSSAATIRRSPSEAHAGSSIGGLLLADSGGRRDRPQFMVLGHRTHQFFLAPVRTPETIAWVAMGFAVDDALARKIHDLAGVDVTLCLHGPAGVTRVGSSLPQPAQTALRADATGPSAGAARVMILARYELSHLRAADRFTRPARRGDPADADGHRVGAISGAARLTSAHRRRDHRAGGRDRHAPRAERYASAGRARACGGAHSARPL